MHDQTKGSVEGAYAGRWMSAANGHTGALQCVVTRRGADRYHFRYRAEWARVFSAGFTIDCALAQGGRIVGSKDLGPLFGGVFHHEGAFNKGKFAACYSAKYDRGTMEMERVSIR